MITVTVTYTELEDSGLSGISYILYLVSDLQRLCWIVEPSKPWWNSVTQVELKQRFTVFCWFTNKKIRITHVSLSLYSAQGEKQRPVMIHRAVLGSFERMISMLIENFGGKWPFWLSPRQCMVMPVHESVNQYVHDVRDKVSTLLIVYFFLFWSQFEFNLGYFSLI